jgi:16S rRNA (guanine527-N7)-methyltransferase
LELQEQYLIDLKKYCWENGLNPDENQLDRLAHFASLVAAKNEIVNLISRKDVKNIIENHVFLSAFTSQFLPDRINKFLDIGTGGGFPGIPLAIVNPLMRGVLVDSTGKKFDAVDEFVKKLKLTNVIAENGRVESDEFKNKYADHFDLVISRGTVPLIILFRYSLPLIKNKAYLIAMKGGDLDSEFKVAEMKYKVYIKKSTIFEMAYKPNNVRNEKGKKLILLELTK